MKKKLSKPDHVVDQFALNLAAAASEQGWIVQRIIGDGSDRTFELVNGATQVQFLAKLSQSDRGLWGVMFGRGDSMIQAREPLALLTSDSRGYFIGPSRIRATLRLASKNKLAYLINEPFIRHEPHFSSTRQLLFLLTNQRAPNR